ncbi:hypothetical protein C8Q80DRAFT_1124492 [Daedaleopsis nitida]|nr:hypothetical protein C8Q80DRAFT_1124492 [Daedaleopsis nitida]
MSGRQWPSGTGLSHGEICLASERARLPSEQTTSATRVAHLPASPFPVLTRLEDNPPVLYPDPSCFSKHGEHSHWLVWAAWRPCFGGALVPTYQISNVAKIYRPVFLPPVLVMLMLTFTPIAGPSTDNATFASFLFDCIRNGFESIVSRPPTPATVRTPPESLLGPETCYHFNTAPATPAMVHGCPPLPPVVVAAPYWRDDWGPVPSLSDVALFTDGPPSHTEVLDYINGRFKFNSEARNAAFDILLPKQRDSSRVPVFSHLMNTAAWRRENPDYPGGLVDTGSDATDPEDEADTDPRSMLNAIPGEYLYSADGARVFLERHDMHDPLSGSAYEESRRSRRGHAALRTDRRRAPSSFASSSQWSSSPLRARNMDADLTLVSSADESEHSTMRRRHSAAIPTSVHHSPSPGADIVAKRRTRSNRSVRRLYGHGRPSVSFTLARPAVDSEALQRPRTSSHTSSRSVYAAPASRDLFPSIVVSSPCPAPPQFVEGSSRGRVRSRKRVRDEDHDEADDEDETALNASGLDEEDADGERGVKKRRKL